MPQVGIYFYNIVCLTIIMSQILLTRQPEPKTTPVNNLLVKEGKKIDDSLIQNITAMDMMGLSWIFNEDEY